MQISKLENEKASGKLNLEALKRKNYSSSPVKKEKLTPRKVIDAPQEPVINSEKKKKPAQPGFGTVIEVVPKQVRE